MKNGNTDNRSPVMTTPSSILTAYLNYLAGNSDQVRQQLQSHAGKTVHFHINSLIQLQTAITQNGYFRTATQDEHPEVTLHIPPELVPRLASGDIAAFREITVSGDPVLADLLLCLGKTFQPIIEENLSSVIGDIFAHRVILVGQELVHWHLGSIRNLSRALGEFITEEWPITAKRTQLHQLNLEMELLQQQVLQLEKRIKALVPPFSQVMETLSSRTNQ